MVRSTQMPNSSSPEPPEHAAQVDESSKRRTQKQDVTDDKKHALRSTTPNRADRQDASKLQRNRDKLKSSYEVEELEEAVSSITLDDAQIRKTGTEPICLNDAGPVPRRSSRQEKMCNSESGLSRAAECTAGSSPPAKKNKPVLDIEENNVAHPRTPRDGEKPSGRTQPSSSVSEPKVLKPRNGKNSEESNDCSSTVSHIESVIVHDGFWTTDTSSKSKSTEATKVTDTGGSRSKKKRIARVSILDLT
ncbi:hypothetical protein CBS63078_6958 [Aspergillus niger]|nr:hypothetical protein CBS115989_9541 [Aspergillus niger]KAI2840178.1 hypothetical protein CBS11232_9185 [Aspergillus niger]KAI2865329.1 hypothetical protein CBS12448_2290 [Aspergillus niger]KAI2889564.1 hypothetical protein CBS11852_6758 [Aspergillus niger]KAI2900671.1 hypothetical protein CBS63078_6958 [Aspergillus niger]